MYQLKNLLVAFGTLSLLIGAIALVTATGTTTITGDISLAPGSSV